MKVVIRTDASLVIGTGHVMRCLTLADALRRRRADISFVCREHPGNLIGLIEGKGYSVVHLRQLELEYIPMLEDVAQATWLGVPWWCDAVDTITALGEKLPHWLIIDHYAIDLRWEEKLRPHVGKIMVIDDTADRSHDCDLLLDQNLYQSMETRYDDLVPGTCKKLLGPAHALLRPEFTVARRNLRKRDGQVRRILVFFGGVDPTNETKKALEALAGISERHFEVDTVVGNENLHKAQIQNLCATYDGFRYYCQVENMAELMTAADLAIGGGGATTWERCFLGLPTITIVLAENQSKAAIAVEKAGASWNLGWYKDVTVSTINLAVGYALDNPAALREMGLKGQLLMGSSGFYDDSFVVNYLLEELHG